MAKFSDNIVAKLRRLREVSGQQAWKKFQPLEEKELSA